MDEDKNFTSYRIVFNASNEIELKGVNNFINNLKIYRPKYLSKCIVNGKEVSLDEEVVEFKSLSEREITLEITISDESNVVMWTLASLYGLSIMYGDSIISSITKL